MASPIRTVSNPTLIAAATAGASNLIPILGTDNLDGTANLNIAGTISATSTMPFSGTADDQAAGAGQGVGILGFDSTGGDWDRVRVANVGTSLAAATQGVLVTQGSLSGTPHQNQIVDGVTPATKASVGAFHNSDAQVPPGSGGSVLTGGVPQLTEGVQGLSNRQRQAGADGVSALGQLAIPLAQEFQGSITAGNLTAGTASPGWAPPSPGTGFTVTPSSMTGWQVGAIGKINDANPELFEVLSVTATTANIIGGGTQGAFKFNHTATYAYIGLFQYNQERDFAGEGHSVNPTGAAIAVEFEDEIGGPPLASGLVSGFTLTADRNWQGKGSAQMAISSTTAGDTILTFTGNPWTSGLVFPTKVILSVTANGAAIEEVIIGKNNVSATGAGPIVVNLATPVVNTGSLFATFDKYALSPGLTGVTPHGIEDNLEYVWSPNASDPKRGLYAVRAADADTMAVNNIPAESLALLNPAGTFDRANGSAIGTSVAAGKTVLAVQGTTGGIAVPISGTVTVTPSGTQNENLTQVGGSAIAIGSAASAASLPVVIASDQAAVAVKYGSGTFAENLTQVGGAAIALGQAAMAASVPVVLASNQSNVPANITQIGGSALAFGSAVSASSIPVVIASDQAAVSVKYGSGNFATNLAQVGGAAVALGSAVSASSVPVVIASDQGSVSIKGTDGSSLQGDGSGNVKVNLNAGSGVTVGAAGFQKLVDTGGANVASITASNSDGQGTATFSLHTRALGYIFNGTTWDRTRSAAGTTGILVTNTEGTKTSYRLAGFVTPGAAPTDVIVLQGSGTKTVRVTHVEITIESSVAGVADVLLIRRSTANSGGTSTTPTIGKLDTNDAAATAVGTVYTANATGLGTTVANLGASKSPGTSAVPLVWDFGTRNARALVLRGTSDFLAINGNGDTLLTGEVWAYELEWSEE